jgi:predicted MFS family arabinose efflux permease
VVLALLMHRIPEPGRATPSPVLASLRAVVSHHWALLVLALGLAEGFVLLGPLTFLPATLQADGIGVTAAGLLTAVYGISVLVFARVVKRRSRATTPTRLIVTGGALAISCYTVLTLSQGMWAVLGGCVLLGAGWAFLHSTIQTWATDVTPDARATAVSLYATMLFTGGALGTTVAGPLVDGSQFRLMVALALAVAVPLALAAAIGRNRYARRTGPGQGA